MRTVHESTFKPKLAAETKFIVDIRRANHNEAALSSIIAAANNNTGPATFEQNFANFDSSGVGVDVGGGTQRQLSRNGAGGSGGGNARNGLTEVKWRRVFTVSSLIVSLFLIIGSIYLHLRQKPHLGRLYHDQPISAAIGVAAALVAPPPTRYLPNNVFATNDKPTLSKLPYSPALQIQLSPLSQSSTIRTLIRSDFPQSIAADNAIAIQTVAVLHANNYNNNDVSTRDNSGFVLASFTAASTPAAIDDVPTHTSASASVSSGAAPSLAAAASGNSFTTSSATKAAPSMLLMDSKQRWNTAPALNSRSRHITEVCMQCICETATECRPGTCGNNTDCGVFRISRTYWWDAGEPALESDVSSNSYNTTTTYTHCVSNLYCATRAVAAYVNKYARDCNGDGVIDCRDHIALHLLGPSGCIVSSGQVSPIYARRMEDCLKKYE